MSLVLARTYQVFVDRRLTNLHVSYMWKKKLNYNVGLPNVFTSSVQKTEAEDLEAFITSDVNVHLNRQRG